MMKARLDTKPASTDRALERPSWLRRIGWFVLIWALSVLGLGIVALFFRLLMKAAGMTS